MWRTLANISLLVSGMSLAGCANSGSQCTRERTPDATAASALSVTNSSEPVSAVWHRLCKAMQKVDRGQLRRLTTEQGYRDVTSSLGSVALKDEEIRQRGLSWDIAKLKLDTAIAEAKIYRIGEELAEQTAVFEETPDGWRLARWFPGY